MNRFIVAGEDLVPKSSREGEAYAGSGDREIADVCGQAAAYDAVRLSSGTLGPG